MFRSSQFCRVAASNANPSTASVPLPNSSMITNDLALARFTAIETYNTTMKIKQKLNELNEVEYLKLKNTIQYN